MMLLFLFGLFVIGYGFGLKWAAKSFTKFNLEASKLMKLLHYVGLTLCIAIWISYVNFGIGLRGLWTTRILILLTLISGLLFGIFANSASMSRIEKLYFKCFSYLPFFTAGFMCSSMTVFATVLSFLGKLVTPSQHIYFEDDQLRIQTSFTGVLGLPSLDVFQKKFLFEQHEKRINNWDGELDSVTVNYEKDSTRIVGYRSFNLHKESKPSTVLFSVKAIK